jgi:prolyl-tRNA synthetase
VRISQLFGETLREPPADVEVVSHQLLLRAGYVRQLSAGIFSYLSLAQRSMRKIEAILREEMDAIGGQEINMPIVHPAEPWKQTGRWDAIDETMVRFKDRGGRDMLLAMTHEEIVATLAHSEIRSYRQLPQLLYQLQTKFRDEARPRGGLIRVREFIMKDSYSLDRDEAGLTKQYIAHYNAYFRIGARVGIPLVAVQSDVGMMGGKVAHEFMYLTSIGEDTLVRCSGCTYAANREVARFAKGAPAADEPQRPIERVHTPGATTIEALASFLGVEARATAKAVFFVGEIGPDAAPKLIVALVRGDMEVNPVAVQNLASARAIRPAHEAEIRAAKMEPGYGSPVGIQPGKAIVVVDELVARSANLVAGANEVDYHLRNTCSGRDYVPDFTGNIVAAYEGAPCVICGSPLQLTRGVEVGNIFKLGTRYSSALGARFLDEAGEERPVIMGCYGIGVGRMLACVAEEHRDARGLSLPISVAPYQVNLVALATTDATRATAERLYGELRSAGVEVLFDDRSVSAGIKFSESDLRGMPLRLLVSERSMKQGQVELKRRSAEAGIMLPVADAIGGVLNEIRALQEEEAGSSRRAPVWDEEQERKLASID